MEGKSTTQNAEIERLYVFCQLIMSDLTLVSRSDLEIFHHQNLANLPYNATEKQRFLKTYKIWVFFSEQ